MSEHLDDRISLHAASRPKNVEQIVRAAKEYEYNAQVPVRFWLRTAAALLKEADIYMREGDDETTYLLLFRHAHLVLAHLEAHPGARDQDNKTLLAQARRQVDRNLRVLDILKPRINQRFERYNEVIKERERQRTTQLQASADGLTQADYTRQTERRKVQRLHGHENSDLAVRLAQQEFQRRAAGRDQPKQSSGPPDGEDLSQRLQSIRARVDHGSKRQHETASSIRRNDQSNSVYSYPGVKTQQSYQIPEFTAAIRKHESISSPPALPPKAASAQSIALPSRPEKIKEIGVHNERHVSNAIDTTYTFAPTAFLENGNPLRTLFLPPTLRTTFLRLAYKNTKANLETCGFLAGTLISNALFVSKLIIPAQVSTSDTCEMTNESQLFDYVDSGADLMILGWIHTHPSQTCFMSSRDLHTHAGYQMMLPESIAIVCAPSKGDVTHGGDWGVYRLTDPPGKMAILNCEKPGIFHPHDVDDIYTDALRPGHVVEAKGLEFDVVDLRDA